MQRLAAAELESLASRDQFCLTCEVRPVSVCGALADDELLGFFALSERRTFAARAPVSREGEALQTIYNVTSGMLRLYTLAADGRRQIVGFLMPGDFLGLSLGERHQFSADAVVATDACCFPRAAFIEFLDRKPHLMRRLHQAAAHEMTAAQLHVALIGKARARTRILAFLLNQRERQARNRGQPSVTVALPMGRADIGDYLGLTIETASRTLNQLARSKLIAIVPDGVRLLDLPAIERLVAEG